MECVFSRQDLSGVAGLAVADGMVYGCGDGGTVFAVSESNDMDEPSLVSSEWETELGEKEDDLVDVYFAPSVSRETIYIATMEKIHALDRESGEWRWTHNTNNTWGSPAVVDSTIFIGSSDGKVHAIGEN